MLRIYEGPETSLTMEVLPDVPRQRVEAAWIWTLDRLLQTHNLLDEIQMMVGPLQQAEPGVSIYEALRRLADSGDLRAREILEYSAWK